MNAPNLEARVAELENRYAELFRLVQSQPAPGGWRSVLGILADDPDIEEFQRDVQRIRDEDRAAAQRDGAL